MTEISHEELRRKFVETYSQCNHRGKVIAHLALIALGRGDVEIARALPELVAIEPGRDAGPVDLDLCDMARSTLPKDEAELWGRLLVEAVNSGNRDALRKAEGLLKRRIAQ